MYYVISCTIITVIIYALYTRCNNWMSILAQTFIKWLINVSSKFMTRHNQELYHIQKYSSKNCCISIVIRLMYITSTNIYIYIYGIDMEVNTNVTANGSSMNGKQLIYLTQTNYISKAFGAKCHMGN